MGDNFFRKNSTTNEPSTTQEEEEAGEEEQFKNLFDRLVERVYPGKELKSKAIKKKKSKPLFETTETEHYTQTYKKNAVTGRMNKVWTCKQCKKMFMKVCSLKDHLRLHLNERPYKCAYCGVGWSQAGNRDRH